MERLVKDRYIELEEFYIPEGRAIMTFKYWKDFDWYLKPDKAGKKRGRVFMVFEGYVHCFLPEMERWIRCKKP